METGENPGVEPALLKPEYPLPNIIAKPPNITAIAIEYECQIATDKRALRITERLPRSAVPKHHRAAAILTLWDRPLEGSVIERRILHMHREPFVLGVGAGAARQKQTITYARHTPCPWSTNQSLPVLCLAS